VDVAASRLLVQELHLPITSSAEHDRLAYGTRWRRDSRRRDSYLESREVSLLSVCGYCEVCSWPAWRHQRVENRRGGTRPSDFNSILMSYVSVPAEHRANDCFT
jgi:hypothetical protein